MNDLIFVIVTTLSILTFIELVDFYFIYKKRRWYQIEAARERCRRKFAILRTHFFELTRKNSIDMDSIAAQFFFLHLTSLVRRPEHFREYINQYLKMLSNTDDKVKTQAIIQQIRAWPTEAHEIVNATGRIIDEELLFVFAPYWFRMLAPIFCFMIHFPILRNYLDDLFDVQRDKTSIKEYKKVNSSVCCAV